MPNISSKKAHEAPIIGKAGEHAVAAELMFRGVNVLWPSVDEGYDLSSGMGCRIQVKTARLRHIEKWCTEGVYTFHFKYQKLMPVSGVQVRIVPRGNLSERCDIVVLLGAEQRRFWVVPSKELDGVHCAYMGPSMDRDFEKDIPDMQEMVRLGFTQKEIGQYYGIGQASVFERLRMAGVPKAQKKYSGALRSYENRWDLILNFGQSATIQLQAPVAEGVPVKKEEA